MFFFFRFWELNSKSPDSICWRSSPATRQKNVRLPRRHLPVPALSRHGDDSQVSHDGDYQAGRGQLYGGSGSWQARGGTAFAQAPVFREQAEGEREEGTMSRLWEIFSRWREDYRETYRDTGRLEELRLCSNIGLNSKNKNWLIGTSLEDLLGKKLRVLQSIRRQSVSAENHLILIDRSYRKWPMM